MGIGNKIKKYRTEKGLTQKALAEQLNVSFQAVSRWENEDVEPSFDCLKQMAEIFGCSIDDLFGIEKKTESQPEKVVEKVVIQEAKPVLAVCERCNKPIYDGNDIVRYNTWVSHGRGGENVPHVSCKKCDERIKRQNQAAEALKLRKKRIRSFIYPSFLFAAGLALAIFYFVSGQFEIGIAALALGTLLFCFLGCVFLDNNFIPEMWISVSEWGFVTMPGVIFEFSIDGILIGIAIKLILAILAFMLGAASVILATILCTALGIFVYPFALYKNIKAGKKQPV